MSDDENRTQELPEISAYLVLTGEARAVDGCSSATGLVATQVWTPKLIKRDGSASGEPVSWGIGIEHKRLDSTDAALQLVLGAIWPAREKIRTYALANTLTGTFVCNVSVYDQRPLYTVRATTLKQLAYFEYELLFDIFDYRGD